MFLTVLVLVQVKSKDEIQQAVKRKIIRTQKSTMNAEDGRRERNNLTQDKTGTDGQKKRKKKRIPFVRSLLKYGKDRDRKKSGHQVVPEFQKGRIMIRSDQETDAKTQEEWKKEEEEARIDNPGMSEDQNKRQDERQRMNQEKPGCSFSTFKKRQQYEDSEDQKRFERRKNRTHLRSGNKDTIDDPHIAIVIVPGERSTIEKGRSGAQTVFSEGHDGIGV